MKIIMIAALSILATAATAAAQTAPDLKGAWSGRVRTVIYGHNPHHPGPADQNTPRIREITYTLDFEGQDGRLLWGKSWSSPDNKEPFAATIAADGRTIIGADTDGSLTITIAAPDRLDLCYVHPALSPTKSIVASCGTLQRSK